MTSWQVEAERKTCCGCTCSEGLLDRFEDLVAAVEQKARAIRKHVIEMVGRAGSGHPGGSLSCADILAALYFGGILRVDPANPAWPDRDRFVLSKGHAAPALYAALAERGFFPVSELETLRQLGSRLQGHPDCRKTPGVDASTGSLGQGLSVAVGMALAGKLDGRNYHVWAILGDGECQEGQIWEAAMSASHYRLGNLTAVIDHNKLQIDGLVTRVMSPEPIAAKFEAFGWETRVVDGHDARKLLCLFKKACEPRERPMAIIALTVKGKGVSFMEGVAEWHGKAPKGTQLEKALQDLDEEARSIHG